MSLHDSVVLFDDLPAQHGGAKAIMLTILGEYVLPAGGSAWTSSMVAAADVLGISEKNARQAIARISDQGIIEADRHGRRVRWSLTQDGRRLLEDGARRIYGFGTSTVEWSGGWLVAHTPMPESQRAVRNRLRTRLAFLGFGELSPNLMISPHLDREPMLRQALHDLGVIEASIILHSTVGTTSENLDLVARAWDLEGLATAYVAFDGAHRPHRPANERETFRAVVELVHDWRRFPFTDPELPTELLPADWAGTTAARAFHDRHRDWSPAALCWFGELEAR
jgi:phenylacetic acid degradation operon negative regulatory protein